MNNECCKKAMLGICVLQFSYAFLLVFATPLQPLSSRIRRQTHGHVLRVAVTCHQYRKDSSLPGYKWMAEYNRLHKKEDDAKACTFQTVESPALLFTAKQLLE